MVDLTHLTVIVIRSKKVASFMKKEKTRRENETFQYPFGQ